MTEPHVALRRQGAKGKPCQVLGWLHVYLTDEAKDEIAKQTGVKGISLDGKRYAHRAVSMNVSMHDPTTKRDDSMLATRKRKIRDRTDSKRCTRFFLNVHLSSDALLTGPNKVGCNFVWRGGVCIRSTGDMSVTSLEPDSCPIDT